MTVSYMACNHVVFNTLLSWRTSTCITFSVQGSKVLLFFWCRRWLEGNRSCLWKSRRCTSQWSVVIASAEETTYLPAVARAISAPWNAEVAPKMSIICPRGALSTGLVKLIGTFIRVDFANSGRH